MVPSVRKELRKRLSTPKVPKVPTPLNAIVVEHECDPIIDVQGNGSVLCEVLVDGRAGVNVMTIPTMRYLGLKIDRPTSVTFKMATKWVVRPKGVINNVVITVMRVSTIVNFHVVLEEDRVYPMILGRHWLTKSHAKNYWGEGYMTIGVHPNNSVATPLWAKCQDETHTPKSGNWESSGTLATSELNNRGQNTLP